MSPAYRAPGPSSLGRSRRRACQTQQPSASTCIPSSRASVARPPLSTRRHARAAGDDAVAPGFLAAGGRGTRAPRNLHTLEPLLNSYGYLAVFALVLAEDFGVPVPGEAILIAAAVYAGAGRLNIFVVFLLAFAAAVLGDNLGYLIGRKGGRGLVLQWGKYVLLTPERLDAAEGFFARHGGKIVTVARFIAGLRQANGIVAGLTHMHWLRFLAFNALGAALWVGAWATAGFVAGQQIQTLYDTVTRFGLYAALLAVAVAVALFIRHRSRKPRPT